LKKILLYAAALALLDLSITAQADVFNLGSGLTNLETSIVGDPGNVGELSGAGAGGYGPDRICGSVGYTYNIGKYEVTTAQYCDFLNYKAKSDPYGLYNIYMDKDVVIDYEGCNIKRSGTDGSYNYSVAADWANRPVNYVSFWDACRFANWLSNGQGMVTQKQEHTYSTARTALRAGVYIVPLMRNGQWQAKMNGIRQRITRVVEKMPVIGIMQRRAT
jgi:hypothetical protein